MNTRAKVIDRVTFRVYDVTIEGDAFPEAKLRDAIAQLVTAENDTQIINIESCSDYNSNCVAGVKWHPLFGAVHLAWSAHRPLVLSPDMVWIAIVQGLSQHMRNDPEAFRDKVVRHQGKQKIAVTTRDVHEGSPESGWDQVIRDLSVGMRSHLNANLNALYSDFSTTGDVERSVCEIALMDVFQPFFEFSVRCICGIPSISLEGTTADWQRLAAMIDALAGYGLDWWLPDLRAIAAQFERSSSGNVDVSFWQDIYRQKEVYGATAINGWLVRLVPYLKSYTSGNFTRRNPQIGKPMRAAVPANLDAAQPNFNFASHDDVTSSSLPSGVSMVPFILESESGSKKSMQFLGGFFGVQQDPTTLELRPQLGWAVAPGGDGQVLANMPEGCAVEPPQAPAVYDKVIAEFCSVEFDSHAPNDFLGFYKQCDGISFPAAGADAMRIRGVNMLERVPRPRLSAASKMRHDQHEYEPAHEGEVVRQRSLWIRFCDLSDGRYVAIELALTRATAFLCDFPVGQERMDALQKWWTLPAYSRVCLIDPQTKEGNVIATSFTEFVDAAFAAMGGTRCLEELKRHGVVSTLP